MRKTCDCPWCKRSRKLRSIFRKMNNLGMYRFVDHLTDVFNDVFEELENVETDLDWIKSGLDNEYVSVKEIMEEFDISEEKMKEFLQKRREKDPEPKLKILGD